MSRTKQTDRRFPPERLGPPAPAVRPPGAEEAPTLGPRYEFHSLLGVGGMSRVYRVLDRARGELVALKILNDGCDAKLGSEFRFIASLSHPGIIAVHDFGLTPAGQPYFTMELVEDGDIVRFARAAPLRQTILAVRGVFETLEFVHARGILHGDLKPGNILVGTLGGERYPKLLDFGIARRAEDADQLLSGTLHYMAPELIVRRQRDRRTDLYAMGAVLYELLCGDVPFDGPNAVGILRQHLVTAPQDPRELRAEADGQLAEVVLRLLEKSPEDRFQRARDAAAALDAWLDATAESGPRFARRSQPPGRRSTRPPPRGAPWGVAEPRVLLAGGARFVGRDRELEQLAAHALRMGSRSTPPSGGGSLWLIAGQPGMGKTRLLQELRVRAQLGGVGCLAVDFEGCRSPVEVLERLGATVAGAAGRPELLRELSQRLAEPAGSADLGLDGAWAEPTPPRVERLILAAEAIAMACNRLADSRPVVLGLDHLDTAAGDAAPALRSFCVGVASSPVMVVAAATDAGSHPLTDLSTIPGRATMELDRLDRDETEQIVRSLLGEMEGSAPIISHVHAEAGGNPGAVERVVRSLVASGAIGVRSDAWVVAAHLGGKLPVMSADSGLEQIARSLLAELDPTERALARAAACLGVRFDARLLAEVVRGGGEPLDEPERALRALVEVGVIEPAIDESDLGAAATSYRFTYRATHELLLTETQAAGERWSERIVTAFAARPPPTLPEELEILARHLLACGRRGEAAEIASKLVERAIDAGLATEAPALLRSALGVSPDDARLAPRRWCELGGLLADFERRSGSVTQAIRWYERVVQAGARSTDLARLIAAARRELGDLLMERGAEDGERTLVRALSEARELGDPRLVGQAAYSWANRLMLGGRHEQAEQRLAEALDVAETSGDRPLRARALKLRAMLRWYRGAAGQAEADAREAAREYALLGSPHGAAVALGALGNALLSGRRLAQADEVFREVLQHARAARWQAGIAKGESALAAVAFLRDDWDGACEHWRASLAIVDRTGDCVDQVVLMNNLGFVASLRGDGAAAAPLYEQALSLARRVGFRKGEALVLGNLGELDLQQGRLSQARTNLGAALEIAESISARDQEVECRRRLLEVELAAGQSRPGELAEAAASLLRRAQAEEVTAEVPQLCRVAAAARASDCDGDGERAEQVAQLLEDAAAGFERLGSRYGAARVVVLAAMLANGGLAPASRLAQRAGDAQKLLRRLRAQPELDRLRSAKGLLRLAGTAESANGPGSRTLESGASLPHEHHAAAASSRAPAADRSPAALPSLVSGNWLRPTLDPALRQLLDALRAISGTLGLGALLPRIVDEAISLTRAERGFIVLCDDAGQPVERVSRGLGGTSLGEEAIRASRTVLARVLSDRQPLMVEGIAGLGPDALGRSLARLGISRVACVPLAVAGALVGLLYLDSPRGVRPWSNEGLSLLLPFAAHAAVAVANAQLLAQHERQTESLATSAHELVNPLRAILGYSRLLLGELGDRAGTAASHVAMVHQQAGRMSRLVSALVELASTEPSTISWTAVSVQIKDLVETAAEPVRPLAAMRGIPLHIEVAQGVPTVFGNRERLVHVVTSLLATAVSLSDGAPVVVTASAALPDVADEAALPIGRASRDPLLPAPEPGWALSPEAPVRIDVRCAEPSDESAAHDAPVETSRPQDRAEARRALLQLLGPGRSAGAPSAAVTADPALRIALRVVEHHGGRLWAEELREGALVLSLLLPSLAQRNEGDGSGSDPTP